MATLKVRVRAASGGPTMRVQVPWPFTVQALKDVISPLIMQPTSSFSLSLNKKVAIDGPGTALLSDFGVINGDLLFYIATQRDSSAAPQPADFPFAHSNEEVATELASTSAPSTSCSPINGKTVEDHGLKGNSTRREAEGFTSLTHEDSSMSLISSSTNFQQKSYAPASLEGACISQNQETVVPMHDAPIPTSMEPTLAAPTDQEVKNVQSAMQFSGDNAMEVEIEEKGGLQSPVEIEKYRVFIPDLLQHVLSIEYQNVKQQQELLVLAVHAVMLETGFVLSGEISSSQGPYGLPTGWSGKGGQVNLTYTLPEIKRESEDAGSHSFVEDMILRCQIVGNTLVVYGVTTSGRGCEVHRVSLPVSSFLNEESVLKGSGSAGNGLMGTKPSAYQAHNVTEQHATNMDVIGMFHNVFELWKEVKDKLSLPLLMCLCERAGLPPPASLLIIPTELKMKVLELLPAIALARIGCVCLELKFLAGIDDLWKIRFKEEFGGVVLGRTSGLQGWKNAFADEWSRRKRWEQKSREADRHMRVPAFGVRIRPRPYVPHFPGVIGGEYDIFPDLRGDLGGGFRPRGWNATLWNS